LHANRKGIWDVKSPCNISKSFLLGQLQTRRLVDKNSMCMHNAPWLSSVSITAIQAVFRSVVLARILYASPTWWGFAGVQDRQKVEGFFCIAAPGPDSAPKTYPTLVTFAWRLIRIYSARYYIIHNMCFVNFFHQFFCLFPQLFP